MIRIALQKHVGGLLTIGVGCWLAFGAKVFFTCPECAGLYDVPTRAVSVDGDADFGAQDGPFFFCQTPACEYVREIRFADWESMLFDVSDAERSS